ncbi:T9SS type A sorting domain-containing protein [Flavobacterium cellulosilyticum]|uniref:T9SS type A sorting domain-containing protein n=1 Tax=Flavobacterium cellulosilyticum TaxID=2541731 RepID=A0A4R5CQ29_9FLAO|nr:T9SS type A sorting domain-containing protein [Flavobacterium cellulosilyticum]TDD99702.1 T9SS type A sorting domain-containing protein [Flavobacterium cellulosilyticum]
MKKKLQKNKKTTAFLLMLLVAVLPIQMMAQKKIAYITLQKTMDPSASTVTNDAIIRMFNADSRFALTVITDDGAGSSGTVLSNYDLVIVQETFGSANTIFDPAGILGIRNIPIPCIFNKVYAFQGSKNHITSIATTTATSNLAVTVDPSKQTNDLFTGITFSGNSIPLFISSGFGDNGAAGGPKSIDVENGLDLSATGTLLATVPEITVVSKALLINDIPAGTKIGTNAADVLQKRMITFGFNYGAMAAGNGTNITPQMLTLWKNAALLLTGQLSVKQNSLADNRVSVSPNPTSGIVTINSTSEVKTITVFDTTGKKVQSAKNSTTVNLANQSKGIYLVQVQTENGTTTKKIVVE